MRTCNPCIAVAVVILCPALTLAGTVSGKVTYTGTPVKQKPISMAPFLMRRVALSATPRLPGLDTVLFKGCAGFLF